MWLLVGLGNPGPKYAQNRHNVGFMTLDLLAKRWGVEGFRAKFGAEVAAGQVASDKAVLVKPQQYMNVSGRAVQAAAAFYQVEPKNIVVVHDEIDLPLGQLRVKVGGGHGGHNGLRSIGQDLGSQEYVRIRCGVGKPGMKEQVADYVLGDFGKKEQTEAEIMIQEAADAVELVIQKGPTLAMNRFNVRKDADS